MENRILAMCHFVKFIMLLALITFSSTVYGQDKFKDSDKAYRICHLTGYHFELSRTLGKEDPLLIDDKSIKEVYSFWMEFTVENPGQLEFLIVPDQSEVDLDFILYEVINGQEMQPLRTMTSGHTFGFTNKECLGQTGLKTSSTDVDEGKGCYDFSDNYLSPISLSKGRTYKLLVNSYNGMAAGFNILFESENDLKLLDECGGPDKPLSASIYPNPTSDFINVFPLSRNQGQVRLEVYDLLGKKIHSKLIPEFIDGEEIDVSDFGAGQYVIRITQGDESRILTFIKE